MAINNFVPTVWSENLYRALDKQYVAVAHCSREYEGDIKGKGNTVKICGLNNITVSDYTKDTNMRAPQALTDNMRELVIDQAKYFNFQIDDVDHTQSVPGLMALAMKNAASALADQADQYVFGLLSQASIKGSITATDGESVINAIIDYRTKLLENNVTDASQIVIEVTPAVAGMILKAKLALSSDNTEALENGCIGSVCGCKIFVSNNLLQNQTETGVAHRCAIRTTRAIAFAEQLSEIEAYRPELRFADAVKGLHLYGAKAVYPSEMVCLDITLPTAAA